MSNELNTKMDRISIKDGSPISSEGENGDLTARLTRKGIRLFLKFRNKWIAFKPED